MHLVIIFEVDLEEVFYLHLRDVINDVLVVQETSVVFSLLPRSHRYHHVVQVLALRGFRRAEALQKEIVYSWSSLS